MNKKIFALISVLVVLSMLLLACAPAQTPAPEQPPVGTEPEAPLATEDPGAAQPPTAGKVQVRWFVGLGTGTGPEQQEIQQQVVQEFNDSHPNIELVLEVVPYDAARDTLATQIAAGNGPDIIGPVGWSGSNAFYGQWLDLGPLIAGTGYNTGQFSDAMIKFNQTEEGQVGLPFAVFPAAVFYQKEMFDEAGLNYPPANFGEPYVWPDGTQAEWNFETLTDVAKLLTVDANGLDATQEGFDADAIVQYGYVPQYQHPNHIGTFWGAGTLYTDDAGITARIPEQWADAWEWYFDGMWGPEPFIPNNAVVESPDFGAGNPFNSGRVAMAITHMWYTCCIADAGQSWDLAALPAYNGRVNGRVDADTFRIWKGTRNPEAAFEVLSYLIGPASLKLLETYGGMPSRADDQDAFFATKMEQYPFVANWDVMQPALDYPDIPSAEGFMPNWNEAWDRVGTFGNLLATDGTIDFQAELQQLESDLQVIFEKE